MLPRSLNLRGRRSLGRIRHGGGGEDDGRGHDYLDRRWGVQGWMPPARLVQMNSATTLRLDDIDDV